MGQHNQIVDILIVEIYPLGRDFDFEIKIEIPESHGLMHTEKFLE